MKRKEIFLVVVLILFGLLYHVYESGEKEFFEACSIDSRSLLDQDNPQDFLAKEYRFEKIKTLEIHNVAGEINVNKSSDEFVVINSVKRIFHKKRQKAADIQEEIEIRLKAIDDVLTVNVDSVGKFPYTRARIIFNVSVPQEVGLKLINRYGDIVIKDTGREIYVDEKYGDLNANDIISNLNILHGYGRVILDSIEGKVEIETRYSKVKILDARSVRIKGRHSRIQLLGIKDDIVVLNSHNSIDLRDIKGNISLNGRHCKIKLLNIDSGYLLIKNSYNDVKVENLWAEEVDVSIANGDLNFSFFDIKKRINIRNKYSNITMVYSDSIKPLFNINLTYGKIINNTSLVLNILSGKYKQIYTSEEGSPKITITNRYGDIVLKNSDIEPRE